MSPDRPNRPDVVGLYNKDEDEYRRLVERVYAEHPPLTVTPEYAQFVEKNLMHFLIRLARYKFAARMLQKTDRVLEVGSGSGLGTQFLAQHCAHATGLELKAGEVEEARAMQRCKNVSFVQADFFDYRPDGDTNAIVSLDVIEHLAPSDGRRMVARMAEVLAPNGMVVIGCPSIYSFPHQSPISQASHVHCYDQQELRALLDDYFTRTVMFSMNDEIVHTGHPKMAWYYFGLGFVPKRG